MRADDGMVIRMPLRIEQLRQAQLDLAVRGVFARLPALVANDLALRVELLERHERTEIAQAIGLEPHEEVDGGRRADVVVVGAILRGPRVVPTARGLHPRVERLRGRAAGAHEHQVLEQVGEAGPSLRLVVRADRIRHVHHRDGNGVVLVDDERHPVRQGRLREGDRYVRRRGRRREEKRGHCRGAVK